jgi:hypothetical protein
VGDQIGTDEAVFERGAFDGSVYPDLPTVGPGMTLGIETAIRRRIQEAATGVRSTGSRGNLIVRTVAAQCLDAKDVSRKVQRAGNLFRGATDVRGALLCVSGGDPGRAATEHSLDSVSILEMAEEMKRRGDIPDEVDLWAVANPMTDTSDSFRRKADAGARCFLTQPPFFRKASHSWFERVSETRQEYGVNVLVGVPMITSIKNLEFWLDLCGVHHGQEAEALKRSFPPATGSSYSADAVIEWNANFIRDVALQLPGVAGMHVMPVTASGLSMMQEVLSRAA